MSSTPTPVNSPVLRVSYIWRDEVMSDTVFGEPQEVTLGTTGSATIVTPDLGLPADFAIFRPGARGYVMTLGAGMAGEVEIGKAKQQIKDFVGAAATGSSEPGGFRGQGIAAGDFGVIRLDASGDHSIFFQFIKKSAELPKSPLVRDTELLLPAYAFAVVLVGFFLIYALAIHEPLGQGFLWPGRRDLVANYLINRPEPIIELEPEEVKAGTDTGEEKAKPVSTAGKIGKSGGEGKKERKRAKDPDQGEPDEPIPERIQVGLLNKKSRDAFEKVRNRGGFDKKLGTALAGLVGETNDGSRGSGDGKGSGIGAGEGSGTTKGTGKGPGGGGSAHADVLTQGKLDTGGKRAARGTPGGKGVKEVAIKVKLSKPSGSLGGLTQDQIMKVVRTRARAIQSCYSRELQRNKGLGGKVVVKWKIDSSGAVQRPAVRSTTMRNGRVEDCVVREVSRMKFPSPKGGGSATVNFPFIFGQQ